MYDASSRFERLLAERGRQRFELSLYVRGLTPRSTASIAAVKSLCERCLEGRYDLEVIDLYQQPSRARAERVVAAPTLVRRLPLPLRRLIGDLTDDERVLAGLEIVH